LVTHGYKKHLLRQTARLPITADTEQNFASCLDCLLLSPASRRPLTESLWTCPRLPNINTTTDAAPDTHTHASTHTHTHTHTHTQDLTHTQHCYEVELFVS